MSRNFKFFGITWLVGLIVFNAVTFLIPSEILGINRFEQPEFWVAYSFIMLAFIAQLVISYAFCKNDTNEKMFLSIPVLKLGYSIIALSVVVGIIFLVVPVIPAWIGAIVCILITAFFIIAMAKANLASNVVLDVGMKIERKTAFIRSAIVEMESLISRANTGDKPEIKKVYDAFVYSDTVSVPELAEIEFQIKNHLNDLRDAVVAGDSPVVSEEATELLSLIKERNSKCKMLK